jgi:hypothetical protein
MIIERSKTKELISGLFLVISVFFFACNRGDSPKAIAETFLGYMNTNDFERAKDLGTEETDRLMDMMSGFKKMMSDSTMEEHNYVIVSEKIEGNVANFIYEDKKSSNGDSEKHSLTLVKEDGKWQVAMNKENYNEALSEPLEVGGTTTQ